MLYITTRGKDDVYTSYRTLVSDCAPDGGPYVPMRMPCYTPEQIAQLKDASFSQAAAQILNMFFSCRFDGWDLDFDIGRSPVRLVPMNHRIVVAELWHNPKASFSYIVDTIYKKVINSEEAKAVPTDWVQIAVRIAVIFGIYSQMLQSGILQPGQSFDFSLYNDDFMTPIAVWYSRNMGLPINKIIVTCEEENSIWDFIHRGVFASAAAGEKLLLGLERLVQGALGFGEVHKFRQAYQKGKVYSVSEEALSAFNSALFCAVTGKNRASVTVNSVFRSNSYIIDPCTALCYAGVQDHRAGTGGNALTVLLSERTPLDFAGEISAATGISGDKLIDHVKLS